jgi:hypothetical protein
MEGIMKTETRLFEFSEILVTISGVKLWDDCERRIVEQMGIRYPSVSGQLITGMAGEEARNLLEDN